MTTLPDLFAALADPTRLAIVEQLAQNGELPAGTIAVSITESVQISAPAVSRHLKVLRESGLVRQRAQGTHRYYTLNPDRLGDIQDWTQRNRDFWSGSLSRLDDLLAQQDGRDLGAPNITDAAKGRS